ncbi:D-glycero-beta-D-manno-heptose-1,7-bisphosphate 7-phosphatase [Salinicola acroporae]|uniref:D,D-heptose 1,7-bisphosphate phosphatase n=1 Tax=Salinicola acroporae TaxID=1541440 RepID=A0ABT6I0Z4_9GAMM|nr:D-glycero-beta-D-manno-heptose-1,7-bisphosphate 7-phosphatase [Salinicola acroporae]
MAHGGCSLKKVIILDRDGVINEDSDAYIKSVDEWHPYPTAFQAIARLGAAGWTVAVATNQSGVGRGYYSGETLTAIHETMLEKARLAGGEITRVLHCPHRPEAGCDCRKPKPGMLLQLQRDLAIPSLEGSWMVGDSLRDIQAGIAAGCRTALVETGKGQRYVDQVRSAFPSTWICHDLDDFVTRITRDQAG